MFQVQAGADNRGRQSEERKTRFVPRSLVQGMMKGPRESERGIQQHCVKRERRRRGGGFENKQTHKLEHVLEDHTHMFGLLNL